jgi:hypothetical protein
MRMVRPLVESSMVPTSFGSAEQRLQRGGSLISGPVIVFALKYFTPAPHQAPVTFAPESEDRINSR